MNLTRPLLDAATERGILSGDQAKALWGFLQTQTADTPAFRPAHILYYLGGLLPSAWQERLA